MDRIEKMIRDAKPPEGPLGERAKADLARILATAPPSAPDHSVRAQQVSRRWTWTVAAAAVFAILITTITFSRSDVAIAATPPMVSITSAATEAAAALQEARDVAASQADLSSRSEIVTQWWALSSQVDSNNTVSTSAIHPRRRITTTGVHGILAYTDYVGQPYDIRGNPVHDDSLPAAGTDLDTVTVDPDQRVFSAEPPSNAAEFGNYLAEALEPYSSSPTVNSFEAINALLSERILTPAQNAALAEHLASLPDIELLGAGTDRLGRSVMVFSAPVEADHQALLMLATDTGRVAAAETIYVGTQRTDIRSPAVIAYTAWEAP